MFVVSVEHISSLTLSYNVISNTVRVFQNVLLCGCLSMTSHAVSPKIFDNLRDKLRIKVIVWYLYQYFV